eukprot:CAMPEP_0170183676 /NCGR_PEP_ID=MMETSP0040_2-20121228/31413_1 /TAXON_ID=641309 /ORGANISM="Lotharella oceanica, Strain CCMP622" /LENGTH=57 /DNA_ID=CAMNT_0010429495 /DNA_START=20 /DNA_END=193 /DNA_ORIENTATION=+
MGNSADTNSGGDGQGNSNAFGGGFGGPGNFDFDSGSDGAFHLEKKKPSEKKDNADDG